MTVSGKNKNTNIQEGRYNSKKKRRNSRNILLEEQDKNNLVTCFMMYILRRQSCETPPLTFLLHLLISPVSLAKLPEIFSKCPYMNRETKDLYSTSM